MRFQGMGGIYRSDVGQTKNQILGAGPTASRRSAPRPRQKNASGGPRPSHRPRWVPHRLFLDRVARQHCPSPLHRHCQNSSGQSAGTGTIIER